MILTLVLVDLSLVSNSDLERAVELARESPLEKLVRLAGPPGGGPLPSKPSSTGQVKSYVRGGHVVTGYQGKVGHAKPGPGRSVSTAAAHLKVGSVIQVGGVAYRVLFVGKYQAPHKGGVVAHTKGKKTTTNTAKQSASAKAAAKAKATSNRSVSPQKALFGGAPSAGQSQVMLQQVSTGARFNVHMPPNTQIPVVVRGG